MNFLPKNKGVFHVLCWKTGLKQVLRTCSRSLPVVANCVWRKRRNRSLHRVNEGFEHRPSAIVNGAVDIKWVFSGLVLASVLMSPACYAEDSLATVMQSMQSERPVKIAYQEIRRLELMDAPWFGSGYLYSQPPDLIIKEQLKPYPVLMAVHADKLLYFDVKNNVRHQAEMDMDNPINQNIAVFTALIHADTGLLKRLFQLEFSHFPQRWLMTLQPKQKSQREISIAVSGPLEQGVDLIKIQQADGDSTEFLLEKQISKSSIEKKINQLYLQLQGE